jgi:hypothetical protein
VFSTMRVTFMTPIYIATGISIVVIAAIAFAIGPDVVRYLRIRSM